MRLRAVARRDAEREGGTLWMHHDTFGACPMRGAGGGRPRDRYGLGKGVVQAGRKRSRSFRGRGLPRLQPRLLAVPSPPDAG